jgi:tetratricopeptide (TPR) repeat protein
MNRSVQSLLIAATLMAVAGCGDAELWVRYQAERSFWRATRQLERIQLNPQVASAADFDRAAAGFRAITRDYPAARWTTPERLRNPYARDIATLSGRAALALAHLDQLRSHADAALTNYAQVQTEFASVPPVALEAALARGTILDEAGKRAEATQVYLGIIGQFPMVDPETGQSVLAVMDAPLRVARDYARVGRAAAADSMLLAAEQSYLAELNHPGIRPADNDLWVRVARARMAGHRVPAALEALRHGLVQPGANVSELLLTMAACCVDGNLPDSAFAYTAWVDRAMDDAARLRALELAAKAWDLKGVPDSALAVWGRVADEAPDGSDPASLARFRRGYIMEALGRWEGARTEYRFVVDENPGNPLALDALSRIVHWHTSHHEMEAARQEARRALGDIDRMIAATSDERRIQRDRAVRAELLVAVEDWPPACEALRDLWTRYPETPEGADAAFKAAELIETRLRDRKRALELYRDLADHAQLDADRRRAQDERERLERQPG